MREELCFLQKHVIGPEPRVNTYPSLDFQLSGSPAQSKLVKTIKNRDAPTQ